MFSDNHKISLRQMQALFCFYFLGTASLFLPAELAEGSGRACWLVMLIGGLLAAFFSLVLTYLGKKEPTWTVVEWLRNTFGGVLGSVLAVFIAGLMVGRTPEYLGKKIDVREMKMIALAILVTPTLVLLGTALAMMTDAGRAGMFNPGPHGFSEVLYAVTSAANNNGSAFAGLGAATPFWNLLLAFCMLAGRFAVIIPVMAIAGSLVAKKIQPASPGTLATHDALFIGLLIGTVLLVGALTFIPALALGPLAEHFSLL